MNGPMWMGWEDCQECPPCYDGFAWVNLRMTPAGQVLDDDDLLIDEGECKAVLGVMNLNYMRSTGVEHVHFIVNEDAETVFEITKLGL